VTGAGAHGLNVTAALSAGPASFPFQLATRVITGEAPIYASHASTMGSGEVRPSVLAELRAAPIEFYAPTKVIRVATHTALTAGPAAVDNSGAKKTSGAGALRADRATADINAGKKYVGAGALVAGATDAEGYGVRWAVGGAQAIEAGMAQTQGEGGPRVLATGVLAADGAIITGEGAVPVKAVGALRAGTAVVEVEALRGQFFSVELFAGAAQVLALGKRTMTVFAIRVDRANTHFRRVDRSTVGGHHG
jgi:hypothetical protein